MKIESISKLNEKLDELYIIEKDYELVRQWALGLKFHDDEFLKLMDMLSSGSLEHKIILEEIYKNFKGLKIPRKKSKFKIDVEPDFIGDALISLLEMENVMERGYMEIYLNTNPELVEKNFKLNPHIFFWIFKSLSYDERNHETLIVEEIRKIRER